MGNMNFVEFSQKIVDKTKKLCRYLGVPVLKYTSPRSKIFFDICGEPFEKNLLHYGFTCYLPPQNESGDNTVVLYNDTVSEREQAMVLLHELGHVLMELWEMPEEQRKTIGDMEQGEFFADMFACIMMALSISDIDVKAVAA